MYVKSPASDLVGRFGLVWLVHLIPSLSLLFDTWSLLSLFSIIASLLKFIRSQSCTALTRWNKAYLQPPPYPAGDDMAQPRIRR